MLYIVLAVLLLGACNTAKTQTLTQIYGDKTLEDITAITLRDGSTGIEKKLTEPAEIASFIQEMQAVTYTLDDDQEARVGWMYNVEITTAKETISFTESEVKGKYYTTSPDSTAIIAKYYTAEKKL